MTHIRTADERISEGRALRDKCSRADHAKWKAPRSRDAVAIVREGDAGRIPKLLALKYARMAISPFAFFRGAVHCMAADLAAHPSTAIDVQICGDAHVRNLGLYAAPDGGLVFDLNDFDETTRAPFEWDLKRLAASLVLAAREAGDADAHAETAVHTFVASYRAVLKKLSPAPFIDVMRFQVRHFDRAQPIHEALHKAERSTPEHSLTTLTQTNKKGMPHFRKQPPILTPITSRTAKAIEAAAGLYRETLAPERQFALDHYTPVDFAFKVVGVGSVGLRDYVMLLLGNGLHDALFMQIKQAVPSAYSPHRPKQQAFFHEGRRVIEGQRRMQAFSDPFLGWTSIEGRDFLVRQLSDHKASIETDDLKGEGLIHYAEVCGAVLAKGHCRSGDPALLYGYCGDNQKLDHALSSFAIAYADQTTADHRKFLKAIQRGQIKVARSPA